MFKVKTFYDPSGIGKARCFFQVSVMLNTWERFTYPKHLLFAGYIPVEGGTHFIDLLRMEPYSALTATNVQRYACRAAVWIHNLVARKQKSNHCANYAPLKDLKWLRNIIPESLKTQKNVCSYIFIGVLLEPYLKINKSKGNPVKATVIPINELGLFLRYTSVWMDTETSVPVL